MKVLSIVIPAYNEEAYISQVLDKVISVDISSYGFSKEIIVVDDGSTDKTNSIVKSYKDVILLQQANKGKGNAVNNGVHQATGDYIIVQDADLEYFPEDYIPMLEALSTTPQAAIYGSRIMGQLKRSGLGLYPGRHPDQDFGPWFAGVLLTFWTFLLYGKWVTDTLTAYKMYPSQIIKNMQIKTTGFETDHEITGKLAKSGITIIEVPIRYDPRTSEEGKKIRSIDGFIAVWSLLRFRFTN